MKKWKNEKMEKMKRKKKKKRTRESPFILLHFFKVNPSMAVTAIARCGQAMDGFQGRFQRKRKMKKWKSQRVFSPSPLAPKSSSSKSSARTCSLHYEQHSRDFYFFLKPWSSISFVKKSRLSEYFFQFNSKWYLLNFFSWQESLEEEDGGRRTEEEEG